jgi:hypothetical protein
MLDAQRVRQTFLVLGLLLCIGLPQVCLAQQGGASTSSAVSLEGKATLQRVRTIAVFLNGADALLTRIAEDAVSVKLMQSGFRVTSREKLDRVLGEELAKKKEKEQGGALNALEIGQIVEANAVLTGTVIVVESEEQFLVKIASLQLVDVQTEDVLINVLFESAGGEKGRSFSEIAREFADILRGSAE